MPAKLTLKKKLFAVRVNTEQNAPTLFNFYDVSSVFH